MEAAVHSRQVGFWDSFVIVFKGSLVASALALIPGALLGVLLLAALL